MEATLSKEIKILEKVGNVVSKFKIMVTLSKSLFKSELRKEVIYYSRNNIDYCDNIIFHNKTISLSGSRTKHMDNTNILETVNSSFYSGLTKALLFAYFERDCFKVKSITVDIDDYIKKTYEEKEIKQVFTKKSWLKLIVSSYFRIRTFRTQ